MVLLEYIPGNTIFHRLDIRSKIIWLVVIIVGSFLFSDPFYVGTIFLFVVVCLVAAKIPLSRLVPYFKVLLIPIIFIVCYEAFVHPGSNVIATLPGGLKITLEGLFIGLTFMFRLLIMVFASTILTFTTPYDHMLSLLVKLRTPYPIVFMLMVGFDFAPFFNVELPLFFVAKKARGLELEKWSGFKQIVSTYIPIMIPLLINGVRRAQQLAMAMVARGFGSSGRWVPLERIQMKLLDYIFLLIMILILVIIIYVRIQGFGVIVFWGS